METKQKIDYSKFKCEVYSPEGVLLQTARINKNHVFYASGLVPGQAYYLVFSYSDCLIECIEFVCETIDRVFYISPAQLIHEHTVNRPPKSFVNSVKGKIKVSKVCNVPPMLWAKKALDAFIESTHESNKKTTFPHGFHAFKAGAALAKSVK
jgi:hypothetical protein